MGRREVGIKPVRFQTTTQGADSLLSVFWSLVDTRVWMAIRFPLMINGIADLGDMAVAPAVPIGAHLELLPLAEHFGELRCILVHRAPEELEAVAVCDLFEMYNGGSIDKETARTWSKIRFLEGKLQTYVAKGERQMQHHRTPAILAVSALTACIFATAARADDLYLRCEFANFRCSPQTYRINLQTGEVAWSCAGASFVGGGNRARISKAGIFVPAADGSEFVSVNRVTGDASILGGDWHGTCRKVEGRVIE